ncbi:MAG: hypothetical protein JAY74_25920, partial [Candidatus Thiodiazotropha taylori]|nr:hypothetical protein [Candidatus Thiodiazotropha taylori]
GNEANCVTVTGVGHKIWREHYFPRVAKSLFTQYVRETDNLMSRSQTGDSGTVGTFADLQENDRPVVGTGYADFECGSMELNSAAGDYRHKVFTDEQTDSQIFTCSTKNMNMPVNKQSQTLELVSSQLSGSPPAFTSTPINQRQTTQTDSIQPQTVDRLYRKMDKMESEIKNIKEAMITSVDHKLNDMKFTLIRLLENVLPMKTYADAVTQNNKNQSADEGFYNHSVIMNASLNSSQTIPKTTYTFDEQPRQRIQRQKNTKQPRVITTEQPRIITDQPKDIMRVQQRVNAYKQQGGRITQQPLANISEQPMSNISEQPMTNISEQPRANISEHLRANISEPLMAIIPEQPRAYISEQPGANIHEQLRTNIPEQLKANISEQLRCRANRSQQRINKTEQNRENISEQQNGNIPEKPNVNEQQIIYITTESPAQQTRLYPSEHLNVDTISNTETAGQTIPVITTSRQPTNRNIVPHISVENNRNEILYQSVPHKASGADVNDRKILLIGDSIFHAINAKGLINGIQKHSRGGATVSELIQDISVYDFKAFNKVIIYVGGNDCARNIEQTDFEDKYDELLSLIKASNNECGIFLCKIAPRGDIDVTPFNNSIERIALYWEKQNVRCIHESHDYFYGKNSMPAYRYYGSDGIHMSSSGTKRLLNAIDDSVKIVTNYALCTFNRVAPQGNGGGQNQGTYNQRPYMNKRGNNRRVQPTYRGNGNKRGSGSNFSGRNRTNKRCHGCHMTGHFIADCWNLNQ